MEVPVIFVEMMLYCSLLYGLCNLRDGILSSTFVYFYLTVVVFSLICFSVCAAAVFIMPSVIAATALVPVYNALNLLFSGYLVPEASIPAALRWLYHVSTVQRPFHGISVNEMKPLVFHCAESELVPFDGDGALYQPAPLGYNNPHYKACPISTGGSALQLLYGLDPSVDKWFLFLTQFVYLCVFQLLLALALHNIGACRM